MDGLPTDVSVVIPVRNGERFVCEAIASALAQTATCREVIVVDNGSTDRTMEVIARASGDAVVLASEPQPGPAPARNRGARMATGTYLAFLDADDVWLPGKLERQIQVLDTHAGANLVFTYCQEFHDPGLAEADRAGFPCRPEPYPCMTASSVILQRKVFQRVGDFPEVRAGEFIAWYGWAQALGFQALVLPEVWVRRRIHGSNSTRERAALSAYPAAAKWLLDRRRQAQQIPNG